VYTNVPTPLAMITNIDDKDLLIFIVGIDIVCVISFFLTMLKLKLKGDPTKAANKDLHGCWLNTSLWTVASHQKLIHRGFSSILSEWTRIFLLFGFESLPKDTSNPS
jgi:hypothetical protein